MNGYRIEQIKDYLADKFNVIDIEFNMFDPNEICITLKNKEGIYEYIERYGDDFTLEKLAEDISRHNEEEGYN